MLKYNKSLHRPAYNKHYKLDNHLCRICIHMHKAYESVQEQGVTREYAYGKHTIRQEGLCGPSLLLENDKLIKQIINGSAYHSCKNITYPYALISLKYESKGREKRKINCKAC